VKDPATGLTWQRLLPVSYDGCSGRYDPEAGNAGDACTWQEARSYCLRLTLAPGGWRLPTSDELSSIVDMAREDPAIDVEAFPSTRAETFWSSSTVAGSPDEAWYVSFGWGFVGNGKMSFNNRVRCAR
jgi:hypothetical protein